MADGIETLSITLDGRTLIWTITREHSVMILQELVQTLGPAREG